MKTVIVYFKLFKLLFHLK